MEEGLSNEDLFELTKIDPWWLAQLRELFDITNWLKARQLTVGAQLTWPWSYFLPNTSFCWPAVLMTQGLEGDARCRAGRVLAKEELPDMSKGSQARLPCCGCGAGCRHSKPETDVGKQGWETGCSIARQADGMSVDMIAGVIVDTGAVSLGYVAEVERPVCRV